MFERECNPLLSNSFFMFGARGTGKSTLVRHLLEEKQPLVIDLLNPDDDERYSRNPQRLLNEVQAKAAGISWIIIDEVQKVPKLLDVVHILLEEKKTRHLLFALTGSSARKLKVAGANLLAGRVYVNELYPLTYTEIGSQFDLNFALNWGTLPKILAPQDDISRQEYLRTYVRVYLKEEVWDERLVHNLDPFRKFIEIAAQTNGMILNYSNIARDTGVDDKTVKKYFEILADTFVGFYLEAYHRSVRKQQSQAPRFFLFDTGVKRAMEGLLTVPLMPGTFAYGRAFEHFIICECVRLNAYHRLDYRFSYLRTKDDVEIDLIIERPGKPPAVIEIKSSERVDDRDISSLKQFFDDFPEADFYVWSQDPHPQLIERVHLLPWQEGLRRVFPIGH